METCPIKRGDHLLTTPFVAHYAPSLMEKPEKSVTIRYILYFLEIQMITLYFSAEGTDYPSYNGNSAYPYFRGLRLVRNRIRGLCYGRGFFKNFIRPSVSFFLPPPTSSDTVTPTSICNCSQEQLLGNVIFL